MILKVSHGYDVQEHDDPFVKMAEDALNSLHLALVPGKFMVDFFPWLRFVPDWMPGTQWKRHAEVWKGLARALQDVPYQWVKDQMVRSTPLLGYLSFYADPDHFYRLQEQLCRRSSRSDLATLIQILPRLNIPPRWSLWIYMQEDPILQCHQSRRSSS